MQGFSIGKLARSANVSIDTIRFYEKSGLLPPPERLPSGFRKYTSADLRRLRFVRRGRELGLSLPDIGELLALEDQGDSAAASESIHRQLRMLDRKLEELERWRDSLKTLAAQLAQPEATTGSILDCFTEDTQDRPAPTIMRAPAA